MKWIWFILTLCLTQFTVAQSNEKDWGTTYGNNYNNSNYGQSPEGSPASDPNYDWSWKQSNNTTSSPMAPPPPPTPVPIDGGAGFLIAAGLGYGLRELKKRKSNK